MLIATKTNNLQQQQQQQQQQQLQQQKNSDITLIGSNVINRNNNNNNKHEVDNKHLPQTTTTTNKLTEFAYGRKEYALLPCDSEAKQRHEALAKKWNMKYMHYKNNNNNNSNNNNNHNVHKDIEKQPQQSSDTSTYLNIRGGGNVERARRGRRPNGRGLGTRGRGMFKGNLNATGKDMPPNSLYAAAMLTVAKMKAKRGGDHNRVLRSTGSRAGQNNNNRSKARLYATWIGGSATNSSASCETKTTTITTTTTTTTTVATNASQNRKNEQKY